jgi:hypothetical protein
LNTASRLSELKGDDGVQDVTRPSLLVVPVKRRGEVREEGGLCKVRVTGMEGAGLPRVVSRTWHVIEGFFSMLAVVVGAGEAISGGFVGGRLVGMCSVRAERRWVAGYEWEVLLMPVGAVD